jgi:hypothetical protein
MFYAKWFGQVLLMLVMVSSVSLFKLTVGAAASLGLLACGWSIWLIGRLIGYWIAPPRHNAVLPFE